MDLLNEILQLSGEARSARIAELTDDQLSELLSAAQERFGEIDGGDNLNDEILAEMAAVADVIEAVGGEQATREEHQAELERQAAEIRARVNGEGSEGDGEEGEGEGAGDAEPATTTEPEGTGDAEPATDAAPAAEPIAAAAATTPPAAAAPAAPSRSPNIRDINARRAPDRRPRETARDRSRSVIRASGDVPGFSAGDEIDARRLGEAFAQKAEHVLAGGSRGRFGVFRQTIQFPEDRTVDFNGDPLRNGAVLAAAHGAGSVDELLTAGIGLEALMYPPTADGLLAAGGLCAPLDTDWGQDVISTAARPIRDFLGRIGARRGGARYIRPPVITDTESASVVWTEANDTTPVDPATKPCLTVTCGSIIEDVINAVTLCLQVGNFEARTFPERFRAWWQTAQAQHARLAEQRLLSDIWNSAITVQVTDDNNLGAARDILEVYKRRRAQLINQYRLPLATTFDVILPAWARDAMVADLIREIPGSTDERLATADATIDRFLAAARLNVLWAMDGRVADQRYPAEGGGALEPWRGIVEGYIFLPGTFGVLDAGTLDLGMEIRDSTLNASNNLRAFLEVFEGLTAPGIHATAIRQEICVNGASGGTVALTCSTSGGS